MGTDEYGNSVAAGVPRYTFDKENHVHRLDGIPLHGTSTACHVIAKPLTWWAAGMAMTPLGWLNKRKSKIADRLNAACDALAKLAKMNPREYADFLETCYRAHSEHKDKSATAGTEMHAGLEDYVKLCIYECAGVPQPSKFGDSEAVTTFADWACANVFEFLWSEAHCYSERLWTGGICDCGAILKSSVGGGIAVLDFKSSADAYFDQFVQCGGYSLQIKENGLFRADGTPVKVGDYVDEIGALIVFPFRGSGPVVRRDVGRFELSFKQAVGLHGHKKAFEAKGGQQP